MCYEVRMDVILQNDSERMRSELTIPSLPTGWRLQGALPRFWIDDGHCACDLVPPGPNAERVARFAKDLLKIGNVKRVEILWSWMGEASADPTEERVSIEDFERRMAADDLPGDLLYRVTDPSRWRRA